MKRIVPPLSNTVLNSSRTQAIAKGKDSREKAQWSSPWQAHSQRNPSDLYLGNRILLVKELNCSIQEQVEIVSRINENLTGTESSP